MLRCVFLSSSVFVLCCSGGDKAEQTSVDRQAFLKHYSEEVVVQAYLEAKIASEGFASAVEALCSSPTTAKIKAAQDTWTVAHLAWEHTSVHSFGPVIDLRLDNKIDFWPSREDKIEAFYAENSSISSSLVATQGALVRGFGVAEYLLFGAHEDSVVASDKRCAFLQAVATNLRDDITAVSSAWETASGNFTAQFQTAGQGSKAYPKQQQAVDALLNAMISALQNWESMKLAKPIGLRDGGKPQPTSVESPDAQISRDLLVANLTGLRQAFSGGEVRDANSLASILASTDPDLADAFEAKLSETIANLNAMEPTLKAAVAAKAVEPQAAFDGIMQLMQWLAVDVAGKLGVTPTFSDNDGD